MSKGGRGKRRTGTYDKIRKARRKRRRKD